jgi:cobalt-zinc-cadmium resistance protein CzcA
MIHRIVQAALRQRFLVLMLTAFITVGGILSFQRMPVDAYPDLAPPQVEIITQWPGHAAEEVERLVTLPLELEMNGVPHMVGDAVDLALRPVRRHPDVRRKHRRLLCAAIVFERLAQATLPTGVTPSMAPLFSPSGLVYRYVLESPDRSPQELKTIEDWVVERAYRSVPGVADDSGFGGTVMQYQVLLDPARIYGYHLTNSAGHTALAANNANAGGGFYSQGGAVLLRARHRTGAQHRGHRKHRRRRNKGVPIRVRDVGEVTIGHAPRLGEFGFQKNDDAVEGVILMLRGEQTQNVLKGVEAKTEELNTASCRPTSNPSLLRPQRSGAAHHRHRRAQPASRHGAGSDRADLLPGQLPRRRHRRAHHSAQPAVRLHRAARARRARQPALHRRHRFRNHHRRHRGDDGKHLPRTGRLRGRQEYNLNEVILAAAKDVDRPIFYSVAVILAGYLPIYALTGPSGKLFHPMAETMSFALVGALILTLTLVPVLASYWFKKGVKEVEPRFRMDEAQIRREAGLVRSTARRPRW